ncbi:MAG: signal peptide peptidase SppA [Acidobacteriota bacterium]
MPDGEYGSPDIPRFPTPDLPPPPAPPLPPPPSRARRRLLLFLGSVLLIFLLFITALLLLVGQFEDGESLAIDFSGDKVALVEVDGEITESREIVDHLRKYWKDDSVRSIVLRVNSPGGGVAASQEIHEEVKRIRASKPIVVSMSGVAASGGYYIACAASKIVANPGTITGSIGVIANWTNYGDLLRWAKLKDVTVKSGSMKDAGSPVREMSRAEEEYFQEIVDDLHAQFVSSVADGRKMPIETVRKLADGRAFTGMQAKKNGLIDEIGDLQDAIALAGRLAGIKGEPRVVEPAKRRLGLLEILFGSLTRYLPVRNSAEPVFEYRWTHEPARLTEN